MKGRKGYLMIAVLLTFLNAVAAVYYGWRSGRHGQETFGSPGFWSSLPSLGATSLANVWVQAVLGSGHFAWWSDD